MKQKILSLLFLNFFLISSQTWAKSEVEDDFDWEENYGACEFAEPAFEEIQKLYKVSCDLETLSKRKGRIKRICACLSKEGANNILVQGILKDTNKIKEKQKEFFEDREEQRKRYKDRYSDVYEQIIIKEGVQAQILGLKLNEENEKNVGCSPNKLSEYITEYYDKNKGHQLSQLNKLRVEVLSKKPIDEVALLAIEANIKDLAKKNTCYAAIDMFRDSKTEDKFKEMREFYKDDPEKLNYINNLVKRLGIGVSGQFDLGKYFDNAVDMTNMLTKATMGVAGQAFGQIGIEGLKALGGSATIACNTSFQELKKVFEDYEKKLIEGGVGLSDADLDNRNDQCKPNDPVCGQFEQRNRDLLNKVKKDYSDTDFSESCISKAEHETFKGMPGKKLLESMRHNWWNTDKYLDLTGVNAEDGQLEREQVTFLRSNPILAKLSANKDTRAKLGKAMRKMAKEVEGMKPDSPELFKAYLKFMKNDVQKIIKENPEAINSNNAFICKKMAGNFTAIHLANDVPEIDSEQPAENELSKIEKWMGKCQKLTFNDASTTNLSETLKIDPFFALSLDADGQQGEVDDFESFSKKICQGWDEKRKNCKNGDIEKCRKDFLKQNDSSEMARFTEEMDGAGVKKFLDNDDMVEIAKPSDEKKQNHDYINAWDEQVGSKMDSNVFAIRGKEKQFYRTQQANLDLSQNTKVVVPKGDQTNSSSDLAESNSNSSGQESIIPQGQQVPDWAKEEKYVDSKRISEAKVPQDLVPNFNTLPPIDQKEALNEVKDLVARQSNLPFDMSDVNEELRKLDDKIVQDYKNDKNQLKKAEDLSSSDKGDQKVKFAGAANAGSHSGGAFRPTQNVNTYSGAGMISGMNSGNSSVGSSGRMRKEDKLSKAYNDAKLQIHENSESGRGIASIEDPKIKLEDKLLKFESVPGLLIDEAAPLIPESHENYLAMKGDQKKLISYLEGNLEKIEINGTKVIKLQDPQESPHAYLLFYVSQNSQGEYSVRPIQRQNTLKDLQNSLR